MKVVIKIARKGKLVANEQKIINDDILKYKRERGFNLEHIISDLVPKACADAFEDFDKEEKKKESK